MGQAFSAQIDAWTRQTEARTLAVFKTAAESVINDVRDRTPVDTGYLRSSWSVTLDGPLPMRGKGGDGYAAPQASAVIATARLGDTIYASFVAVYAASVEYGRQGREGRGMVRLAVQNWPAHVQRAIAVGKASVASRQ